MPHRVIMGYNGVISVISIFAGDILRKWHSFSAWRIENSMRFPQENGPIVDVDVGSATADMVRSNRDGDDDLAKYRYYIANFFVKTCKTM
jgi:hypothetical protein